MLSKILKDQRVLYFLGGALGATLGVSLLKSETSRKLCVKGISQGMRLHRNALEAFENMKEEAADICCDAKEQSGTES